MSTTSLTGLQTAGERLGRPAMLLPADLPWIVRRVVRAVAPAALVITETELWANLIRVAAVDGVPVLLLSARVTPRGAERYAWIRPLIRGALGYVSSVAAQTEGDAARLIALGAPPERVSVTGSLKLARTHTAASAPACPLQLGERPLLVAASTHAGEEEAVLQASRALWERHPAALVLIAPRRPERFAAVAALLDAAGVRWIRRTATAGAVRREAQVLLLDTTGELPAFLRHASMVFVGGTLAALGGHNVLEPAAFGRPVCFGPNTHDVGEAADLLLDSNAGVRVAGAEALAREWERALEQPERARAMGERARAAVERYAGVAVRLADLVGDAAGRGA